MATTTSTVHEDTDSEHMREMIISCFYMPSCLLLLLVAYTDFHVQSFVRGSGFALFHF